MITVCGSLTEGGARARAAGPRLPGGGPAARRRALARRSGGRNPAPAARHRPRPRRVVLGQPGALSGRRRAAAGGAAGAGGVVRLHGGRAGRRRGLEGAGRRGRGARGLHGTSGLPRSLPRSWPWPTSLVSPRLHGENTPFKVYTYLASGKPVVATRLPTHTQLMDDSIAVLVEPTAAGLAGGIRSVLADPRSRPARRPRARPDRARLQPAPLRREGGPRVRGGGGLGRKNRHGPSLPPAPESKIRRILVVDDMGLRMKSAGHRSALSSTVYGFRGRDGGRGNPKGSPRARRVRALSSAATSAPSSMVRSPRRKSSLRASRSFR